MVGQTRNIFLSYLISYIAFSTKPGHHKMEELKLKKNTFSKEYYFCEDFKKPGKLIFYIQMINLKIFLSSVTLYDLFPILLFCKDVNCNFHKPGVIYFSIKTLTTIKVHSHSSIKEYLYHFYYQQYFKQY